MGTLQAVVVHILHSALLITRWTRCIEHRAWSIGLVHVAEIELSSVSPNFTT